MQMISLRLFLHVCLASTDDDAVQGEFIFKSWFIACFADSSTTDSKAKAFAVTETV